MRSILWENKPWQAFKTFAIIFSFIVNIVLVIVLLLVAPLILPIVGNIVNPLVGNLNTSFEEMGSASIEQTIQVNDTMPISFTLPLKQNTKVVLSEAVPLQVNARFALPGGGGTINGLVSLELPAGLSLPVQLDLSVPVDQEIPVALSVPVKIPLHETQLGTPFSRLQNTFAPLANLLDGLPKSNQELSDRLLNGSGTSPEEQARLDH